MHQQGWRAFYGAMIICTCEAQGDIEEGSIMRFPVWWNRSEFFKRNSHREIDLGNPIDANYVWVLTSAETITRNEECKERFTSDPRSYEQNITEAMRQMETALSKARWVLIESYEWESGLD